VISRRIFLMVSGAAAATAGALGAVPAAAQSVVAPTALRSGPDTALSEPDLYQPGLYQINGRVRLNEPLVEIDGIANTHQITWSGSNSTPRVAGFSSFETFDRAWRMPDIQVRGGTLEQLSVVPIVFV
jgi:hypothetical protein